MIKGPFMVNKKLPYYLICVTGGDRVGKNTQAKLLAKALGTKIISFPNYDSLSGQLIRGALTCSTLTLSRTLHSGDLEERTEHTDIWDKRKDPYHFQCLQMLSRLEAQPMIMEELNHNHLVADRYDIDALVYGRLDGCNPYWITNMLTCIKRSDLVIVLDGPTFSRDEIADINETDANFSEAVKEEYRRIALSNLYSIVQTDSSSDKLESIYKTHMNMMDKVNLFFIRERQDFKYNHLTLEEIRKCLLL